MRAAFHLCRQLGLMFSLVGLLHPDAADAAEVLRPEVQLLSRYPAGSTPGTPAVLAAIEALGRAGDADETALLASLAREEGEPTAAAAQRALDAIRERQRQSQRQQFAQSIYRTALPAAAVTAEADRCHAYARRLVGVTRPIPEVGGRERAAALEDAGQVSAAVRQYAALAAEGDPAARQDLDAFGIDSERLLLGMLHLPTAPGQPPQDAKTLDVLVRRGGGLTVAVLAERTRAPAISEQATAADALARMLDPRQRDVPLRAEAETQARTALSVAARESAPGVREIAADALSRAPSP